MLFFLWEKLLRIESLALEGIASGPAEPLDIEEIRKEVHQRLAADSP